MQRPDRVVSAPVLLLLSGVQPHQECLAYHGLLPSAISFQDRSSRSSDGDDNREPPTNLLRPDYRLSPRFSNARKQLSRSRPVLFLRKAQGEGYHHVRRHSGVINNVQLGLKRCSRPCNSAAGLCWVWGFREPLSDGGRPSPFSSRPARPGPTFSASPACPGG
jgi:hypothetical protein